MHLPESFPMQDVTPPPSGAIVTLNRPPSREYVNREFGVRMTITNTARGAILQYRADCLPGKTFNSMDDLRAAYNALPGNEQPVIYIQSPGVLQ